MATSTTTAQHSQAESDQFMRSSGARDSVWVHRDPYSNRPRFSPLTEDIECDVCIVGAGISGISTAYELVSRGKQVVLIEARDVLSGETGRTSGHLTFSLDDGYVAIAKKHGKDGAKAAAESHAWAVGRVGEIASKLGIDCEYRRLPSYELSQYPRGDKRHDDEVKEMKEEAEMARELGIDVRYVDGLAVKGWNGDIDQKDGLIFENQATFHPTKYLGGVLEWLQKQPNFRCYTRTRMMSMEEEGLEIAGLGRSTVKVKTESGHTISASAGVEATCIPLQKLSVVAELVYNRTYCIAVRVPKGSIEDCLINDQAEAYKYVRFTECDDKDDYLVIGGCDHKVGQEETEPRFAELETWVRERFPQAGAVDYRWSGQINDPHDYMGLIGRNPGNKHIFIITGDSGDGLTHGVLAGRLLADEIEDVPNPWASLYAPTRIASFLKSLPSTIGHALQINAQYKRFLQSDIQDIEDLVPGTGGVLNPKTGKPVAVYKGEDGKVEKFSALCPHLKGVVCWNHAEKSWDCPVHGSRFSAHGVCVIGPAKANLSPADEAGQVTQDKALTS